MNVGFIGLGKLGLPVAYAMASRGLTVYGHDPYVTEPPQDTSHEARFAETIAKAEDRLHFASLETVVRNCDVMFVAVQTPHAPEFEGITPLTEDRKDFDYTWLIQACKHISEEADRQRKDVTVSVISTVLPGTMRRYVLPRLSERVTLVYNPSFIAMGSTIRDFLHPEFVLIGGDTNQVVQGVYARVYGFDKPEYVTTSIDNAELIKVAYNTFIGLKIAFANTLMEVCHKTECDVDEVTGALKKAHRRLISGAYMDGGMGDGGGCHPRDNIALSWLARELNLSHDLFEDAMVCREDHARWLARMVYDKCCETGLPAGILGTAYKPDSHLETGSPALLVKRLLEDMGGQVNAVDLYSARGGTRHMDEPHVWLVGCRHTAWPTMPLAEGSVVIDPFRYIPDQEGVEVIRLGQWEPARTDISASTPRTLAA